MRVDIREKSYDGKKLILKNIHLTFPKGKTTLMIGTSGAGKSTLIKCLIQQTSFQGVITDENVSQKDMLKNIAYIPQHPALNKNETAQQSIYWTARLNSLFESKSSLMQKTEKCIHDVGIDYVKESLIKDLSGGQMQRVAIAKELIRDKEILIADEIDTGLDCGVARSLCHMLSDIAHREDKTVIVISHNLTNIELYDKVVVLVKDDDKIGRIAFSGNPKEMQDFFGIDDYVDILLKLNSKDEGGMGKAGYYINKFERGMDA